MTQIQRNGQRENRTLHTRIFSPVLYQLSYLPFDRSNIELSGGYVKQLPAFLPVYLAFPLGI